MKKDATPKPKNVDYFRVPRPLWRQIKKVLLKQPKQRGPGRSPADNRAVLNGIWYVLWTGCQWKAVHKDWFGVCSSTLHERFQHWQQSGIFDQIMHIMVKFYAKKRQIKWRWQALDSKSCPAPLGGKETGRNPTDRGKRGSKIRLLVDQCGAPLAVFIAGANCRRDAVREALKAVVFVHAGRDVLVPHRIHCQLVEAHQAPGSVEKQRVLHRVALADAGHPLTIQRPDLVRQRMKEFLELAVA